MYKKDLYYFRTQFIYNIILDQKPDLVKILMAV